MFKRILDVTASILGLIILSPVLAVVAVTVRLTSVGPALFRQVRVGRGGQNIVLCKFRTMRMQGTGDRREQRANVERPTVNTDPNKEKNRSPKSEVHATFEAGATNRVTPIGKVLRKTKLDELPQLWNVIKGDMSLVGPRPEVRKWVEAYPERWTKVLIVRPGITDPASIEFRNEEEILAAAADPERLYREAILPRKLDLYEEYVRTRSFWGDVAILIKTVWAVIVR
ncbi:MAG: sugar transferase [bacterium]